MMRASHDPSIDSLEGHRYTFPVGPPSELDRDLIVDFVVFHHTHQFIQGPDLLAVDRRNDVAQLHPAVDGLAGTLQPGLLRPGATRHLTDNQPLDPPPFGHRIGNERDPEPRTEEFAVLDQLWNDAVDRVDRHGKSDSGEGPARAYNLRIHADQSTGAIEQWPTGVSRIDGGISLNNPFNRPVRQGLDRPPQSTHHAGRQRMIQAERIPDRQYFLSDAQIL